MKIIETSFNCLERSRRTLHILKRKERQIFLGFLAAKTELERSVNLIGKGYSSLSGVPFEVKKVLLYITVLVKKINN